MTGPTHSIEEIATAMRDWTVLDHNDRPDARISRSEVWKLVSGFADELDKALASGGSGEAPVGLTEQQLDAFIAALPGVRVIVRERNARYFDGPPGRYVDPPIPSHIDHDLTRQEIRDALEAALRGPVAGGGAL